MSKGQVKKPKKIRYGLNVRKDNAFGEDSNSSESEDAAGDDNDDRMIVNRDLKAEQEALRKRAAATAAAAAASLDLYDYDGVYDEMHPAPESKQPKEKPDTKKSRYIGDLLKASKTRERERDIVYERKISREQAQEEAEFHGKEKFVTKAYKQKLAERELWAQEEEERRRDEEKEDVTKKTSDGAFASFYGNLSRNVAMGGEEQELLRRRNVQEASKNKEEIGLNGKSVVAMDTEEKRPGLDKEEYESKAEAPRGVGAEAISASMREARAEKLAKARLRYFQRQGLTEAMAGQKQ